MNQPPDPFHSFNITEFGVRLRRGETSAEAVAADFLLRITALDNRLGAFTHVASEQALVAARAVDQLLSAGTDLGPLMGVPVAIKDLFTVPGMPTMAGSRIDVADLVEPEGCFVSALKRAGCVILGKTVTTEFALGMFNPTHRTPWNPHDMNVARMPGGSSSGSAVALAAGLAAFSIGSDTGGSVRIPAALCGVFGFKSSPGLWATDGVFPLASTLDSIGFFSASAHDAAVIFSALTGQAVPSSRPIRGLRLGRPANHFFDDLDPEVARRVNAAFSALEQGGAQIIPFEIKEADEIDTVFARMVPAELIATLGRERFLDGREIIDLVAWQRAVGGLDLTAVEYIRLLRRHRTLCRLAEEKMHGLDVWVTPTTPELPPSIADFATVDVVAAWNKRMTHNTRPANLFGQCAVSMALPGPGLPIGLQLVAAGGCDAMLLSIAQGVENVLGVLPRPRI